MPGHWKKIPFVIGDRAEILKVICTHAGTLDS
jgi:hypothetical protein